MVAKISIGNSLYGALAYNGEKINEAKGRLLTTNRIYNDGTGTMDIHRAMEDFLALMPVRSKVEKPVVHISLNPHPDDILTDTELQNIAREYLSHRLPASSSASTRAATCRTSPYSASRPSMPTAYKAILSPAPS